MIKHLYYIYDVPCIFYSTHPKENLDNLKDIVKPVFLLDQKYYKVGVSLKSLSSFARLKKLHLIRLYCTTHSCLASITFLNGGLMEYHVDAYEDAVCVGYYGENCKKTIVDDAYYKKYMAHHNFSYQT